MGLTAKSLPKLGPSPSSPQEGQASQLQQLTGGHVPHPARGERCGRLEASSSLPQLFLFTRMAMSLIPRRGGRLENFIEPSTALPFHSGGHVPHPARGERCGRPESFIEPSTALPFHTGGCSPSLSLAWPQHTIPAWISASPLLSLSISGVAAAYYPGVDKCEPTASLSPRRRRSQQQTLGLLSCCSSRLQSCAAKDGQPLELLGRRGLNRCFLASLTFSIRLHVFLFFLGPACDRSLRLCMAFWQKPCCVFVFRPSQVSKSFIKRLRGIIRP